MSQRSFGIIAMMCLLTANVAPARGATVVYNVKEILTTKPQLPTQMPIDLYLYGSVTFDTTLQNVVANDLILQGRPLTDYSESGRGVNWQWVESGSGLYFETLTNAYGYVRFDNHFYYDVALSTVANNGSPAFTFGYGPLVGGAFGISDFYEFASTDPLPEPGALTLLGIGIAGLAGYGWRRRQKSSAVLRQLHG